MLYLLCYKKWPKHLEKLIEKTLPKEFVKSQFLNFHLPVPLCEIKKYSILVHIPTL